MVGYEEEEEEEACNVGLVSGSSRAIQVGGNVCYRWRFGARIRLRLDNRGVYFRGSVRK